MSLRETVICPASPFHDEEASLDSRLSDDIHKVSFEYSCGVSFLYWTVLLDHQVARAVRRFCAEPEPAPDWQETFSEDPHASNLERCVEMFGGRVFIDAQMRRPPDFVEEHRTSKRVYVGEISHATPSKARTFAEEVDKQKKAFVFERFSAPSARVEAAIREQRFPSVIDIENSDSEKQLRREFERLASRGHRWEQFLVSKEMFGVPFLDIFCSVYGALSFYASQRKARGSDFDDVPILATVIPYCKLVTMDSGMHELSSKIDLEAMYGFEAYRPTADDVQRLIARLSEL